MITITIDGSTFSGKTLIAYRIANLLQSEGVDVTILTETAPMESQIKKFTNPIDELTDKHITVAIHDLNGGNFNSAIHESIIFKGMK